MQGLARADDGELSATAKGPQRRLADVDDLESISPRGMTIREVDVHPLEGRDLDGGDIRSGHGDQIDVIPTQIKQLGVIGFSRAS